MDGQVQEVITNLLVALTFNRNVGMPTCIELSRASPTAGPIANGIAVELNGNAADIPNCTGLFFIKLVAPGCRKNYEVPVMPEILEICHTELFSPLPRRF